MTTPSPSPVEHDPAVTVIVLNWNGKRLLPDCLDALAKQDLDASRWQAWVVDNGSTDGSAELVEQDHPHVRVVRNGANLGYAGGNNQGLKLVTTPYVVLLNNDARPEPDWLGHLLAAAEAPDASEVAAISSKVLFEPQFLELDIDTPVYRTAADPRELGVQITRVEVNGEDVTDEVLWDQAAYGPEGHPPHRFRWTRPAGTLLIPVPAEAAAGVLPEGLEVAVTARAERAKPLTLRWEGGESSVELPAPDNGSAPGPGQGAVHRVNVPGDVGYVDVVNNVGSVMVPGGYGADRGYQEVDSGQYEQVEDVFLMCGCAVILRSDALGEVGFFDDDFFLYYEDTDLSWRLRSAGWGIRYDPAPVVRHLHSASSGEWSPLFTFHVERNRLLTLLKNASARMALGQFLRFNVTTLSQLRWELMQAVRDRRRPGVRPLLLRLRVTGSYLRLLPRMLARRRQVKRAQQQGPDALLAQWVTGQRC